MKKLIVTMWTTLDGFIAGPNGELDWILGDDEMSAYEIGLVSNADTLLLGRGTYEDFRGYWPHVLDNPDAAAWEKTYARRLSEMHKVVLSRTLEQADWGDSTILRELVPAEIERLKAEPGKDIVIYGSASVVQQLTNLGLIDEYHLLVHPVLLGSGRPLFEGIQQKVVMTPATQEPFKSGVVLLTYQVARA
jgi:dihydrofolate reductase